MRLLCVVVASSHRKDDLLCCGKRSAFKAESEGSPWHAQPTGPILS